MSSKRRLRKKICTSKVKFESNDDARKALGRMFVRGHIDGRMDVYKCKFCSGYHIGHSKGRNH